VLNNYYTLLHLSREFNAALSGVRVRQASTRLKHTLDIIFETQNDGLAGLVVSCAPQNNFIYIEGSANGKMKGANVFPEMIGKMVAAVGVVDNERQLYVEFTDHNFLRINLFGSAANAYYTNSEGVIVNSFLKPSASIGKRLAIPPNSVDFPTDSDDLRLRFLDTTGDIAHRLSRAIPTVDSILAREISYRYYLSQGKHHDHDNDARVEFESLNKVLATIRNELLAPLPRIYFSDNDGKPVAFGLIELGYLQVKALKKYDSVNACARDFVINFDRSKKTLNVKADVVRRLNRKIDFMRRTMAKIEADLTNDRSERYQHFGEYLMSHLPDIKQGDTSIPIEQSETEIKLDPALKPVQNAQAYFDKAKHARLSIRQAELRKKELTTELKETESLLEQVRQQENIEPREQDKFFTSLKENRSVEESLRSPFREFEHNGYRIYVGKDAKNNDELTFGFAKPNDIFLHARGVSGSHVLIKNFSREYPQKPVLQFAARIAAHYSKARSSGIVPVAYTMRKFVKKAKGKPGAVFLDREEVIFVKPGIPDKSATQEKSPKKRFKGK
jgi:predicted ribosome quality control (RQC) complex YloA/Tae2 family protein